MPITCYGHPWGGERQSAMMTGLKLPPPSEGLRDQLPIAGWGPFTAKRRKRRHSERQRERWCWRSDVVYASAVPNHQGLYLLTDSIETSTDNLSIHKRTSR